MAAPLTIKQEERLNILRSVSVLQKLVGAWHHYSSGTHLGLEALHKPCMNVSRKMIKAMYMGVYFHG